MSASEPEKLPAPARLDRRELLKLHAGAWLVLELEKFAQAPGLRPAHRNLSLLAIVHTQLIAAPEPGHDFLAFTAITRFQIPSGTPNLIKRLQDLARNFRVHSRVHHLALFAILTAVFPQYRTKHRDHLVVEMSN